MESYLLLLVGTFLISLFLINALVPTSIKLGLVDKPSERKSHEGNIPNTGGLAMFLALTLSSILFLDNLASFYYVAVGLSLVVIVGLLDDYFELSVKSRFYTQIFAASFIAIMGDIAINNLGNLFGLGPIFLGIFAIPVTVFCAVGAINAFNMSDGMDGLAGSIAFVTLTSIAILCALSGIYVMLKPILLLIAVTAGFLCFNLRIFGRKKAKIFMGDAGSLFLGLSIAALLVAVTQANEPAMRPITALWLFALPLLDTGGIMLKRIRLGKSPFKADRNHLHHILDEAGYSVNQSLLIMLGFHSLLAGIGIVSEILAIPQAIMFFGFLGIFLAYYLVVFRSASVAQHLGKVLTPVTPEKPVNVPETMPPTVTISSAQSDIAAEQPSQAA